MCGITAIGEFNSEEGGHLVLWEARLVIQFPAMSTIFIPSAIVSHSNVIIDENERRYSVTQYSPAGLFRWVACGFRSQTALEAAGGRLEESGHDLWSRGVQMLTTWTDMQSI